MANLHIPTTSSHIVAVQQLPLLANIKTAVIITTRFKVIKKIIVKQTHLWTCIQLDMGQTVSSLWWESHIDTT